MKRLYYVFSIFLLLLLMLYYPAGCAPQGGSEAEYGANGGAENAHPKAGDESRESEHPATETVDGGFETESEAAKGADKVLEQESGAKEGSGAPDEAGSKTAEGFDGADEPKDLGSEGILEAFEAKAGAYEPGQEMDLRYAERFSVKFGADGTAFLEINTDSAEQGGERYALLPQEASSQNKETDNAAASEAESVAANGPDNKPESAAAAGADDAAANEAEGATAIEPGEAGLSYLEWEGKRYCVIPQAPSSVYVASSQTMDLFLRIGALDSVKMTSQDAAGWTIREISEAVSSNEILYVGKYKAPDYEMILDKGCSLAVENTMIYHAPEAREQLERMGIPVLVDFSSHEAHPLGRLEWIRLYGLITGRSEEADRIFFDAVERYEEISEKAETLPTGGSKTAAFFYISPQGLANVRRPKDYIVQMIENAGGEYVFSYLDPEGEDGLSMMNLQMESFYEAARNADILIYNCTIGERIETLRELLSKSALLSDFKAVKNGNVWCLDADFYQQTSRIVELAEDFYSLFSGKTEEGEFAFLYRLRDS